MNVLEAEAQEAFIQVCWLDNNSEASCGYIREIPIFKANTDPRFRTGKQRVCNCSSYCPQQKAVSAAAVLQALDCV